MRRVLIGLIVRLAKLGIGLRINNKCAGRNGWLDVRVGAEQTAIERGE